MQLGCWVWGGWMDLLRLVPSLLGMAWVRHMAMGAGSEVSFHSSMSAGLNVAMSAWFRLAARVSSSFVKGRDAGGGGPLTLQWLMPSWNFWRRCAILPTLSARQLNEW